MFDKPQALSSHRAQIKQCNHVWRRSIKKEMIARVRQQRQLSVGSTTEVEDELRLESSFGASSTVEIDVLYDNPVDWHQDMQQMDISTPDVEEGLPPRSLARQDVLPEDEEELYSSTTFSSMAPAQEIIEPFPGPAGRIVAYATPYFREILDKCMNEHGENIYYPFANSVDWELADWLHESTTKTDIDKFLHNPYVSIYLSIDV